MAVKARAEITLSSIRDVQSVTRYYLLQSSTSAVPSKPTTNPPGGNWVTTEPTYTTGSTNSLYFSDCTVFSDSTFVYSDVSLSSSYEAAKVAYNKAENAETIAEKATHSINLIPFGSRSFDDTYYWNNGFLTNGYTSNGVVWNTEQLADGWIHVVGDATGYTGTAKYSSDNVKVRKSLSIRPNTLYTILYEVRNNNSILASTSANNSYFYIQEATGNQFWGNAAAEVLEGSSSTGSFVLRTMAPEQNTTYRKRFTKMSDAGTHAGDNPGFLFQMQYRYGKGDYLDFELRISIYEGRYLGDYMPYVVSDTTDLSTAISAAQSTADGKNTVYYQASAPTGGTYKVNDIWFDTNDGNKMYMWNGTAWTAETFGTAAISDLSITNAKIANATIQSAKIANLDAGKITTGTMSASRIKGDTLTLGGANNVDGMMAVYDANGNLVGSFTREGLMAIAGTIGGWTINSSELTGEWQEAYRHFESLLSPVLGLQFEETSTEPGFDAQFLNSIWYGTAGMSFFKRRTINDAVQQVSAFISADVNGAWTGSNNEGRITISPHLHVDGSGIDTTGLEADYLSLKTLVDGTYIRQPAMIMSGVVTISTGTSEKNLTLCTVPTEYQSGYRIVPFVSRRYGNQTGTPSDSGDFYYAYYNSITHNVHIKLANKLPSGTIFQFDYMIYAVPES